MMRRLVLLAGLLLTGCTTVHDFGNGRIAVPRLVEVRSPFGTNAGFVLVEHCEAAASTWFRTQEYFDCHPLTGWVPISSQGQGGQIVQGLLNGAGLVGLGALMPASSTNVSVTGGNASAASSAAIVNGAGKHGH